MPKLNLNESTYFVNQIFEAAELFGFETRNKYEILTQDSRRIAYAAEQSKGMFNFLFRQFLGHWRNFDIHVFAPDRTHLLIAKHPFRFFFNQLDVFEADGRHVGSIRKRFAIFRKRFDVHNSHNKVVLEVSSPIWKIWTFPFRRSGEELATVKKKWAGFLSEGFTDKDKFQVLFNSSQLNNDERYLVLLSSIYIDLVYFEKKAGN